MLKRDYILKNLRGKRHSIARRTRKHQYVLSTELDLQTVDNMYSAFNNLVSSVPEIFKNLANAISRFEQRK